MAAKDHVLYLFLSIYLHRRRWSFSFISFYFFLAKCVCVLHLYKSPTHHRRNTHTRTQHRIFNAFSIWYYVQREMPSIKSCAADWGKNQNNNTSPRHWLMCEGIVHSYKCDATIYFDRLDCIEQNIWIKNNTHRYSRPTLPGFCISFFV